VEYGGGMRPELTTESLFQSRCEHGYTGGERKGCACDSCVDLGIVRGSLCRLLDKMGESLYYSSSPPLWLAALLCGGALIVVLAIFAVLRHV
jgi:hypothetical protein